MRATIDRGQLGITVDAFGGEREVTELVDALKLAMGAAGFRTWRQLPARLLAYADDVPELAERARVWLEDRGVVVEVRDW